MFWVSLNKKNIFVIANTCVRTLKKGDIAEVCDLEMVTINEGPQIMGQFRGWILNGNGTIDSSFGVKILVFTKDF